MLPVLGAAGAYFAWAAATPGGIEPDGRRAGLVEMANEMTLGGVAVPYLAIALAMLWNFVRMGWRWADEVAVAVTEQGLRFHPTLLRRRIRWDELRDVRIRTGRRGRGRARAIVFRLRDRSIVVAPFEEEGAEAFVALVLSRFTPRI